MTQTSNSNLPLVDVVMITYNQEKYIEEGIRGVIKQKGDFRLRLIIMDDCSSDRTLEIAESWQSKYPEIISVYRNKHNLGLLRNYIEGFSRCEGDYLAVCDADDYWFDSRKLDRQVTYMEQHPECAITFHRVVNLYEETGEKSLSNGGQIVDTTIVDLSKSNYITNLSVVYRRKLVDLKNLPEWILRTPVPDYAFHFLYAMKGSIHYFRRPMGVYRQLKSATWSLADQFDRLKISLTTRYNLIREIKELPPQAKEELLKATQNILRSMYACADTLEKRKYVLDKATELGIDTARVTANPNPPTKSGLKKFMSRARAVLSHAVPCPKP